MEERRRMMDPELRETMLDLLIGCVLHSLIFEIIGLIAVRNRVAFTLGILLGTATALCCGYSMYRSIAKCAGMDPFSARRTMTVSSILRMAAMFAAGAAGLLTGQLSFFGILIGLVGLKTAAYLHVYTNVYITRRFFNKYLKETR